jgi:hypothetical protein
MNESNELLADFNSKVKGKWHLLSGRGDGARGELLEALLGKPIDNKSEPDYKGIELKTQLQSSKSMITLFSKSPEKNAELREKFGTTQIGADGSPIKRLNATFSANGFTNTEKNNYNFSLKLEPASNKMFIIVKDKIGNIVSDVDYYWDLDDIKESVCAIILL